MQGALIPHSGFSVLREQKTHTKIRNTVGWRRCKVCMCVGGEEGFSLTPKTHHPEPVQQGLCMEGPPLQAPRGRLPTPCLIFKWCRALLKTIFSPRRFPHAISLQLPRCWGVGTHNVSAFKESRVLPRERNIDLCDCSSPCEGSDAVPEMLSLTSG